jgi:hypothetical protein
LYAEVHKNRFTRGEACSIRTEEANFLIESIFKEYPNIKMPNQRTVVNWLSKYGYGKWENHENNLHE